VKQVVCFGEVLLRLAPTQRHTLLQTPDLQATFASAEGNVAVALARFGTPATLLTVLPDSTLGQAARDELRRHGVDTSQVAVAPGRMGLFFYTPGAVRRPSEILYDRAGSAFALNPALCLSKQAIQNAAWFHVSGVTPALGPAAAAAAIDAAKQARAAGAAVSFDGNFRAKLWEGRHEQAPSILRQLFEAADIVFGDERDISLVLERPFPNIDTATAAAFAAFPQLQRIAHTTRAAHAVDRQDYGARMHTRTGSHAVSAVELTGIVDRVGTGDAFAAGVIHGLLTNMSDAGALEFGHAAACLKHSIPGDFMTLGADAVRHAMSGGSLDVRR
jgi:2-dehydro-3-deoxygluconokinase